MAWILLTIAGLLEVVWATALKQSEGFTRPLPSAIMVVTLIGSFALLAAAMRTLPLGTAYTVWTGIGAVGAFVVGFSVMGEPINLPRLLAALLILSGIILMKFTSH
ncbi:multidrug efflux SMR transporter [Sphingomonas sp. AP4-R1]|uniref:DMT family transporter n=1 Tax=Sphingomonas sp. AP4-R1 TaxID=2735134 RepID=UPI0014939122|nr:multidrug efflux SMR transporter [Sphingomonas sp. AP4-R1]QJU59317.1 multidrug efflux SMR transporter [Sphingomonas sp. AP4-R1]